jgi:hypothetical protein
MATLSCAVRVRSQGRSLQQREDGISSANMILSPSAAVQESSGGLTGSCSSRNQYHDVVMSPVGKKSCSDPRASILNVRLWLVPSA